MCIGSHLCGRQTICWRRAGGGDGHLWVSWFGAGTLQIPQETLYKKNVLITRGRFRPFTLLHNDMLQGAPCLLGQFRQYTALLPVTMGPPLFLAHI